MDAIEKDVAMLQDKGWNISCDTQYWVQEKAQSGNWYIVEVCFSLDEAVAARKEHIDKWRIELEHVRIVMRHVVEVVL